VARSSSIKLGLGMFHPASRRRGCGYSRPGVHVAVSRGRPAGDELIAVYNRMVDNLRESAHAARQHHFLGQILAVSPSGSSSSISISASATSTRPPSAWDDWRAS
jgi:hypothetical protein